MKKLILIALFMSGCATRRYTFMEIREYDQAIRLAEDHGIDTRSMHNKLVEMLISYAEHPAEDPYVRAARIQSQAAGVQAGAIFYQATKPEPPPVPMSPGEYSRRMR